MVRPKRPQKTHPRGVRGLFLSLATSSLMSCGAPEPKPEEAGLSFEGLARPENVCPPASHWIVGTEGPDTLIGTDGVDCILARGGNDVIFARGGDDVVYGEAGDDTIAAEAGNDRVWGGGGDDELQGGTGDDQLIGNRGNDRIHGGAGRDVLAGNEGDDLLFGDEDNDIIQGHDGNDAIEAGPGNDEVRGGSGDDRIDGGDGDDLVRGGEGSDTITGGGHDRIDGELGCDTVNGTPDPTCDDACPTDPLKTAPGLCGCGVSDADSDGDGTANCIDGCPIDASKTTAGVCGCGASETDSDGDGTPDCVDGCPGDASKLTGGICGCGTADSDTDSDTFADCVDGCPSDLSKTEPGFCGCGAADVDGDGDGVLNCLDQCPSDSSKTSPGLCGCGVVDPTCTDECPSDPNKMTPGLCGCGVADTDGDSDGTPDCLDGCAVDPNKTAAGTCGCGVADVDNDGDGSPDCVDECPSDGAKVAPGACGCGVSDVDTDDDGTADCSDECPTDSAKAFVGVCGCGVSDEDMNGNGTADCKDPVRLEHFVHPQVGHHLGRGFDISGDGRFVVYTSNLGHEGLGVAPGVVQLYIKEMSSGQTNLVSGDVAAKAGNGDSFTPTVSSDGRFVVFLSQATNLVSEETGQQPRVNAYFKDTWTGEIRFLNGFDGTSVLVGSLDFPVQNVTISDNGFFVMLSTYIVSEGDPWSGLPNYFLIDTRDWTRSRPVPETYANNFMDVSEDGRYFVLEASEALVPEDGNSGVDVYLRDLATGQFTLLRGDSPGGFAPCISSNGSRVFFNGNFRANLYDVASATTQSIGFDDTGSPITNPYIEGCSGGGDRALLARGEPFFSTLFIREITSGSTRAIGVVNNGVGSRLADSGGHALFFGYVGAQGASEHGLWWYPL